MVIPFLIEDKRLLNQRLILDSILTLWIPRTRRRIKRTIWYLSVQRHINLGRIQKPDNERLIPDWHLIGQGSTELGQIFGESETVEVYDLLEKHYLFISSAFSKNSETNWKK